jgi:hypothetical protein
MMEVDELTKSFCKDRRFLLVLIRLCTKLSIVSMFFLREASDPKLRTLSISRRGPNSV